MKPPLKPAPADPADRAPQHRGAVRKQVNAKASKGYFFLAKVNFLELDDDGFFPQDRPRFRMKAPKRNMPCTCCGTPNRLTDAEYTTGISCEECEEDG